MFNLWFLRLFGLALLITGVALLLSGNLQLASRTPGKVIQFTGLSLLLFGLSPSVLGATMWWLSDKPHARNSAGVQLAIGAAIGCMIMALLLAKRF